MKNTEIKTKKLIIRPLSDEELEALCKSVTDAEEKKAYGEMLEGCRSHHVNRLWYTAWEISLRETGERVSNVILMGIGEPLDNYENVIRFIHMISDEHGLHISQRNLTISTCGLVEQMKRLGGEKLTITLAISLHAPNDALRQEMMPIANKYSIQEIISACREYIDLTKRRITFEYSMVEGKNDSKECALQLAALLSGMNCHVNLIPLNPVEGRMGQRSRRDNILDFKLLLEKNHINVTIRREMGRDIDGACGQLRRRKMHQD